MAYNKHQALMHNTNAIEVAAELLTGNHHTVKTFGLDTDPERCKEVLSLYSGFGGLKEVLWIDLFLENTEENRSKIEERKKELHGLETDLQQLASVICKTSQLTNIPVKNIADSIKASVLTAFYTPKEVVKAVATALQHTFDVFGIKGVSFLETSVGTQGFLPVATAGMKKVAFEKDIVSAMIAQALYQDVDVLNDPFETIDNQTGIPSKFDVIASNIPFGDIPVADLQFMNVDDDHKAAAQKLHTYFFMKSMEKLENGGILAFITSRGVADSRENQFLRSWMTNNGNLLCALRLPDNLFMDGSGVEVGSDLIIFQRDIHKAWNTVAEQQFKETFCKEIQGIECQWLNRYLCQARQAIYTTMKVETNQYGEYRPTYKWNESMEMLQLTLADRMCRDMERNFRKSAWMFGHDTLRQALDAMVLRNKGQQNNKRTKQQDNAQQKREQIAPLIAEMMGYYNALMINERRDHQPDHQNRLHLNDAYDKLVAECGTLHSNAKVCDGYISEWNLVLSLENKNADGTYTKADVFDHPIAYRIIKPGETVTPMEALAMSLNERGRVDMNYMGELTKMLDAEITEALKGEIFLYPIIKGGKYELDWQHKSMTLNGDVISKRKQVEEYLKTPQPPLGGASSEPSNNRTIEIEHLNTTLAALKEVTPKPIAFNDIDILLGARWLPGEFFARFAKQQFVLRYTPTVEYVPQTDDFHIEDMYSWGSETAREYEYGNERQLAEIFRYALGDNCPVFKKTEHGITYKDTQAIRAVQHIIDRMRREFKVWIKSDAISQEERNMIQTLYNEKFNCFVRNNFDGSLQTFPGLDFSQLGFSDLYQSQKDCIWMIKQNNGGVGYHTVGAGKTMIMVVASYEMHRLGLAQKPLIIGMKANVAQIAETYRKAYPNARILYPTEKDYSTKNRRELFNKISNNDWDCVILSHDQFNLIPQAEEIEIQMIQEEVNDLEQVFEYMYGVDIDKNERRRKKNLEKSLETMKAKMMLLRQKIAERDDQTMLNFRQLGFDHIFVDESHNFKNLRFNTRHTRVAGLGNNSGAEKSWKLLLAIRDIQQRKGGKDMCASFFSGTVISNALTELYVLFKYLRPNALERQNIRCFDAWAGNFTEKKIDYDLTITGEIKAKERFRTYINVPELSQFMAEITDYRTADMINLDRPKANTIFDNAEPTPEQADMLKKLIDYASSGNYDKLGIGSRQTNGKGKNSDGTMLIATDIARKVSLDPRIISTELFSDHPMNKASRCASRIADYYLKYNEHKGTQFVFCDLSAPTEDNIKAGKWNIYEDIKNKLIADYGIPAEEIAFIHDAKTDAQREELFAAMNEGRVRVLFGSTQKLGTGVNAQERAVAVHHLDIPWKPSDLEQRDGRAVRKGNTVKEWGGNQVDVIIYATNRTLDMYKASLIQAKAKFISQISNNSIGTRHMDEDDMDENSGMNFAEYVAILSGNDDLLKKAKLDNKIGALEADQLSHQRNQTAAKEKLEQSREALSKLETAYARISADLDDITAALANGNRLSIVNAENPTPEAQVKALHQWRGDHNHINGVEIGKVGSLNIQMITHVDGKGVYQYQEFAVKAPNSNMRYNCSERGTLPVSNDATLTYFNGVTDYMKQLLVKNEANQKIRKDEIDQFTFEANREWDGWDELNALIAERTALSEHIDKDIEAREQARTETVMANGHDEEASE